ncbi:gamma-aminobutyric acid type B receptor subunit 2-like isoform X2 [Lineus longissimus]|uniref:gamma-aminobutyric acid type B receptor subunit 2-like isoform X2 n=1 Tax=Lineus longissimus TaxID=88925 RepID=UPI00315C6C64
MAYFKSTRFTTILILFSILRQGEGKTQLHVGGFSVLSKHWWYHAQTFPYVIQSAFEDINNTDAILKDYELVLHMKDTQGKPSLAVRSLFEYSNEKPVKIMLIGPAKSEPAVAVGEVIQEWNLLSLIYSARSSDLDDRTRFPNVYRVNFQDRSYNPVRIALMKEFSWEAVATVTPSTEPFFSQMDHFVSLVQAYNFTVKGSIILQSDESAHIRSKLKLMKQYDARIIVSNVHDLYVRQTFCEALKLGLTGKKYQWILLDFAATPGWPHTLDLSWGTPAPHECTTSELYQAAEGYLSLGQMDYLSNANVTTISGMTPLEIDQRAIKRYAHLLPQNDLSYSHGYAYDAAWAIGVALNKSIEKLKPLNKRLEDFTYQDSGMLAVMREALEETNFYGATGPLAFTKNGTRLGTTHIRQWRDNVSHDVGEYDDSRTHPHIEWYKDDKIVWPGGYPPKDSFERREETTVLPLALTVVINCLCLFGAMTAVGFLAFNIHQRNNRVIKMSSPRLNNFICIGAIIMYASVILASIDSRWVTVDAYAILCNVQVWLTSVAFTMAFGAVFAKMWRAHMLFTNEALKKKIIRDHHLFAIISLLIGCDALVLGLWMGFDRLRSFTLQAESRIDPNNDDLIVVPNYVGCSSAYINYWQIAVYSYKGLILVIGTFIAWETRKVNIPGLNDSKSICVCVYNITVLSAFAVPISHILTHEQYTVRYGLISVLVIFCTTLTLLLIFVPKAMLKVNKVTIGRFTADGSSIGTKSEHSVTGTERSINLTTQDSRIADGNSTTSLSVITVRPAKSSRGCLVEELTT